MAKILCVIDGMSDSSFDADRYSHLSSFPFRDEIGTVPEGFGAETLTCVLTLLGIRPEKNIRGWIEALGMGIEIPPECLIFRGSWAELDENGICVGFGDAPENIPELDGVKYIGLNSYKSLLLVLGYAAFADRINADLSFDMIGKRLDKSAYPDIPLIWEAIRSLNAASSSRAMILWAQSAAKTLPEFPQKAAVITGTNVVRGIAKALGMHLVSTENMTGDIDTDLIEKLNRALDLAEEYPFVMLHIGGCDEAAHRKDAAQKEAFLQRVDSTVLPGLLRSGHNIVVVSDHGSCPVSGGHTGGLQPVFRNFNA